MKIYAIRSVLIAAVVLLLNPAPRFVQAATITSDFEDGTTQGWTINAATTFEQRPTGGNPDGHLFIDNTELHIATLLAPSSFLGNLSAFNGGTFSFDGKLLGSGGSIWNSAGQDYGWVKVTGTNADSASLDLLPSGAVPSSSVWETFSTVFTALAWGKSDAAWIAILADVAEITIVVEGLYGPEMQGIDNISLTSTVPLPAALPLYGTGLAIVGWFGWFRRRKRAAAKTDSDAIV